MQGSAIFGQTLGTVQLASLHVRNPFQTLKIVPWKTLKRLGKRTIYLHSCARGGGRKEKGKGAVEREEASGFLFDHYYLSICSAALGGPLSIYSRSIQLDPSNLGKPPFTGWGRQSKKGSLYFQEWRTVFNTEFLPRFLQPSAQYYSEIDREDTRFNGSTYLWPLRQQIELFFGSSDGSEEWAIDGLIRQLSPLNFKPHVLSHHEPYSEKILCAGAVQSAK